MLYYSTKTLLRTILHSLETATEVGWDDQIESGKECLYELHQMSGPGVTAQSDRQVTEKMNRAIPHVNSMLRAIRRRDRDAAVEHGKAAFAEM